MSETVANEAIRDTNTYTYTNDSGAIAGTQLFHIVSTLDAEITVTFFGTRQEDADSFDDGIELGSQTVSANGNGFETLSDPWEEMKVEIVASTTPTTGTVSVYQMK